MAFYRGEEGSVKFKNGAGTTAAIASTTGWSLSVSKDVLDCTAHGAGSRSYVGSLYSGTGSVDLLYTAEGSGASDEFIKDILTKEDAGDAQFELYFGDGTKKLTFTGVVTSADFGATTGDLQTVSVGFQTSGDIDDTV
tara:strand:- start:237 stop:650 length:414 start_codon:yes stop_codon:yes gene_type:complete